MIVITISDVHEALISLDIDKSSGKDEISLRVLQNCAGSLCVPLHTQFIYHVLKFASIPSKWWKIHKIIPVFKACNSNSVANYSSISL